MITPKYWSSSALIFTNVVCLFNAIVSIGVLIAMIVITYRYNKIMKKNKDYRMKYKFIFEDLKADKQPAHLYFVLFIVRRYILVTCLIAFPKMYFL